MSLIKTDNEIEKLREGGRRHAFILREVAKAVKPGVSTKELDDLAYRLITEGGDKPSFLNYTPHGADRPFPASTCISVNEDIIHGIPNEEPRILKEGDIVGLDIGLIHKGMFTDSAVTVAVGKVSETNAKLLEATKEALKRGIAAAQGGNRIGDIGYAIEQYAKKTGFKLAEDLCGHGVGYSVHEDPYVPNTGKRGTGMVLKPGMVIAIEPMLNEGTGKIVLRDDGYTYRTADNKMSAHFEHTILITEKDPEILTQG